VHMSEPSNVSPSPGRSPGSGFWTFLRILNVRLRFVFLMVLVGLVAGYWENIVNHVDRWRRPVRVVQAAAQADVEYFCPMHPNIVRSEPGSCPICGMPLAERPRTEVKALPPGVLAQVQLTPLKVQLGRIGTSPVEYRLLAHEIRTVGTVDYDETRRAFIAARIKGRIDKLMVNYTGQHVEKGDPLVWIYSPDLLVAQEELLSAVRTRDRQRSAGDLAGLGAQTLVEAARKKLVLWGITDQQIDEIIKRGTPETHLTVYSPMSGIVTERKVLEGNYVSEGQDLYTIADLSRVWMQTSIFEDQLAGVKVGTAVAVTSTAYPNEVFAGRITFIAYTVDPATRTVAARVEIANPELKLRPGMYAEAVIRLPAGQITPIASSTQSAEATSPTTGAATAPADESPTIDLARAYLALASAYAADKTDPSAAEALARHAHALAAKDRSAAAIADLADALKDKDLKAQREQFKTLSAKTIAYLKAHPPAGLELYVAHCPMVDADWLQESKSVANPYYGSEMLTCGDITGQIKASAVVEHERYATGYFCPIYPNQLFDHPAECPIDKFPTRLVRAEKVLAVPETAVVDTGTRKVIYRESAPGTFDMVEVQTGPRAGDFYPVLSGLKAGDRVATAGAFLVDAENRLNPSAGVQYFGASK
jgi:Cu(I)/Ag(I) efflux system membrane fusion protein